MSTKITKEDLRSPDQVTKTLREGFVWTTKHSTIVLVAIGVFVALGLLISAVSYFNEKKEIAQQEKFFHLEKNYKNLKEGYEQAARAELMAAQSKDKKAPVDAGKKASGDLQKDYGTVVSGLESFLADDNKTKAAFMAALNLSEIYLEYGKDAEAMSALSKVEGHLSKNDMLSGLVWIQMGNILAKQNNCEGAISKWQVVSQSKGLSFAHDEAKLRMALCYESLNDLTKAEELYSDIGKKQDSTDYTAAREAQKYLRLLKAKKNL